MNVNFFGWVREGVRQSVLLGVSDAIEQLGTPASTEEMHPSVLAFLQPGAASASGSEVAPARLPMQANGNAGSNRSKKRLGRSLKDIQGEGSGQ